MPRLLIIDDNVSVQQSLEYFFQPEGYEVFLAGDGETGLRLAADHAVDVVLLDIEMPRMSGFAVCKSLKESPNLRQIPVVMMTGRPNKDLIARALACGAVKVLGKPFELADLRVTIAACLAAPAAIPVPAIH